MSIAASSELMSLCRSQLGLLQSWGAVYSMVYLTEKVPEGVKTHFVPLLVYPELTNPGVMPTVGILPAGGNLEDPDELEIDQIESGVSSDKSLLARKKLPKLPYELFLPLIHEQLAIGLLVTARQDRSWNQQEKQQIENIAQTIAIACVMERQLIQQQKLQSRQRDLLDNLLHQIRSPLTAIRTFGKLLFKRLLPENRDREIVMGIVQQSDRLKELLEQIDASLDLNAETALILEGTTPIDVNIPVTEPEHSSLLLLPGYSLEDRALTLETCDLLSVIEPSILSARAIAQEKQQEVMLNIPGELPLIAANSSALREVLSNIIDNALKYTPSGGKIWIEVGRDFYQSTPTNPGFLDITIADNGCGINAEDLKRIFERSYRGVQAKTDIPGTGLGLAIAKELIEKIGGKIEVCSPPQPDLQIPTGTSFTVWLPIVQKFN